MLCVSQAFQVGIDMKYLVKAKLRESSKPELLQVIADGTLGAGSVAFGEYVKNMQQARVLDDGTVCWLEMCFCRSPLDEEMPYWEKYFTDIQIESARDPKGCKDANGEQRMACYECSCTDALEEEMLSWGKPFIS